MTPRSNIVMLATVAAVGAVAVCAVRARDVPRVVTGFVANILCSETFVSGLRPEKIISETTRVMPGAGLIRWALNYNVDGARRDVNVALLGLSRSHSVYREGFGCYLDHGQAAIDLGAIPSSADLQPPLLPEIAGASQVESLNSELAAALDRAFAEPDASRSRRTKAVIVVKDGHIIAERYANDVGIDTPLLGFSMTKSVTSALIGILVRERKLVPDHSAPIAAWQKPGDPRAVITLDQLLRHTAGLALGNSLFASLGAALEPVNRMKFMEADMAAFAESMPLETAPGQVWNYHDGNYLILSQLIRDAVGGSAADVLRFARTELFGALGMRHVTVEFDGAGTPEGSSQMLASARDWARFGLLYLNDGVVGAKRILPEGWVSYSASPTANAFVGYGAGFWTNQGESFGAKYRTEQGWPRDAFFAKGSLGQYVIIIPSQRLVIVRLGVSPNWPLSADGVSRLVSDVVAATRDKDRWAGAN